MSHRQIANAWWPGFAHAEECARRRLRELQDTRLLERVRVMARALPPMTEAVLQWEPKATVPDFGSVAWKLQSRWTTEPRQTTVWFATKKATQLFGGKSPGRIKQEYQATHDLGVSEMYLILRNNRPSLAQHWIGEDQLAPHRRGQKLPDAVIAPQPEERPELVLEFGGAYDKPRLIDFHADCEQRGLPYEIW